MSPTVPIILVLLAVGLVRRRVRVSQEEPRNEEAGASSAASWRSQWRPGQRTLPSAKLVISALVVIPLLVSTIVQFGFIIALVSRLTKGKVQPAGIPGRRS